MNKGEYEAIKLFIGRAVIDVARYCYAHQNPDPDDPRTGWRTVKEWVKVIEERYDEEIMGIKPTKIVAVANTPQEVHSVIETIIEAPITIGGGMLSGAKAAVGKVFHAFKVVPDEEKPKEEG